MPATKTTPAPDLTNYSLLSLIEASRRGAPAEAATAPEVQLHSRLLEDADVAVKARQGAVLPTRALARKLTSGTPSAGGNLVSQAVAAVAQAVRPVLVLEASGGEALEAPGGEDFSLPVMTPDLLKAGWIGEAAHAPFQNLAVQSVSFSARGAASRIAYSRRAARSAAVLLESVLLNELRRAVAETIEDGFFNGTGSSGQPLGIINVPGITRETFAAAVPTASELADMIDAAGAADADLSRCSWIIGPAALVALLKSGAIAWEDGAHRLHGFVVRATTHCPAGRYLFGDWSTVKMAYFGPPTVIVDSFSNGKSITGDREIVIINYCDVGLAHPEMIVMGAH